eukprot:TRINITY_DN21849_c0_g1_i5.p2 TRINITY_DN21849_c0_g1~~TRINITY_DN21849_c0_g1_i5.p2  ORF type:complete len:309 (-),score=29.36 TRINITY_DN21849_c0_g1_i5:780-1706(-)
MQMGLIFMLVLQVDVTLAQSQSLFQFVQQSPDNCLDLCEDDNTTAVCCSGSEYKNQCSAQCILPVSEYLLCSEQPCQDSEKQNEPCRNTGERVCCGGREFYDLCQASKKLNDTSGCTQGECRKTVENGGCGCPSINAPVCCQDQKEFLNSCFAKCSLGSTQECVPQECEKECTCREGEDKESVDTVCCLLDRQFKNRCLARCELGPTLADSLYICLEGDCTQSPDPSALSPSPTPPPPPMMAPSPTNNIRPIEEIQCDNFPRDVCISCAPGTLLPNYFYNPLVGECQPTNCCNFGAFFSQDACQNQCS